MHPPSVRDDPAQSSPHPPLKAADTFRMGEYIQPAADMPKSLSAFIIFFYFLLGRV